MVRLHKFLRLAKSDGSLVCVLTFKVRYSAFIMVLTLDLAGFLQFLYEAGFGSSQCSVHSGMIGVTQPRRVAVLATAKRVAFELGLRLGKEVGFQVRYDKRIGNSCSIKFMTDGILLRELQVLLFVRATFV